MVRVIVDIGHLGGVHVHLEAALDALERADGVPDGLRRQPVGEGDGGCGDAVFGIDPARCPHADVPKDSARIVKVIDEMPQRVRAGVFGMEIGRAACIVIS